MGALEDGYEYRVGMGELAVLKDGFCKANLGHLEEGAAGQMLSGLSNVLSGKRDLSESEIAQLKGKDFHAVLYKRLRSSKVRLGIEATDASAKSAD